MSFSNLSVNQNRNVQDLSKYIIGASINKQEESSGIVAGTALMGGISGSIWAYQNRKDLKGGFQKLANDAQTQKNLVNSAKNKWAGAAEVTSKAELEKIAQKAGEIDKKTKLPKNAALQTEVQKALAKGKDFTKSLKQIEAKQAKETLNKYNAKVASQIANGSKLRKIKNATGITKLSKTTKELAANSGKFRGLLKGIKGNAGFAAISLGLGVLTDVVPAFGLSTEKGFKQLGKTAAKTGCEVAGWAAGSALGAKAGAVIGSFCGPIGTVVGGAIGLVGGFVGSFLASKAADKVIGPSEVELAEQEAANQIAQQANSDTQALDELALASYEQLVTRAANGELTEDDMAAKKALEGIIGCEINLEEAVRTQQNVQTAQAKESPQQADVKSQELLAQNKTEKEKITEDTEPQGTSKTEERKEQQANIQTPMYNPIYGFNPYMTNNLYAMNNFNPYMMNNLYTMNNFNTNPYSNDIYFKNTFAYVDPAKMNFPGMNFQQVS